MGLYNQLVFNEDRPKFVGLPIDQMFQATQQLDERYWRNLAAKDQLDIMADNIDVREKDTLFKENRVNEIRSQFEDVTKSNDFSHATRTVQESTKGLLTDEALNRSIQARKEQLSFIKEITDRKDLSETDKNLLIKDENDRYQGVKLNPNTGRYEASVNGYVPGDMNVNLIERYDKMMKDFAVQETGAGDAHIVTIGGNKYIETTTGSRKLITADRISSFIDNYTKQDPELARYLKDKSYIEGLNINENTASNYIDYFSSLNKEIEQVNEEIENYNKTNGKKEDKTKLIPYDLNKFYNIEINPDGTISKSYNLNALKDTYGKVLENNILNSAKQAMIDKYKLDSNTFQSTLKPDDYDVATYSAGLNSKINDQVVFSINEGTYQPKVGVTFDQLNSTYNDAVNLQNSFLKTKGLDYQNVLQYLIDNEKDANGNPVYSQKDMDRYLKDNIVPADYYGRREKYILNSLNPEEKQQYINNKMTILRAKTNRDIVSKNALQNKEVQQQITNEREFFKNPVSKVVNISSLNAEGIKQLYNDFFLGLSDDDIYNYINKSKTIPQNILNKKYEVGLPIGNKSTIMTGRDIWEVYLNKRGNKVSHDINNYMKDNPFTISGFVLNEKGIGKENQGQITATENLLTETVLSNSGGFSIYAEDGNVVTFDQFRKKHNLNDYNVSVKPLAGKLGGADGYDAFYITLEPTKDALAKGKKLKSFSTYIMPNNEASDLFKQTSTSLVNDALINSGFKKLVVDSKHAAVTGGDKNGIWKLSDDQVNSMQDQDRSVYKIARESYAEQTYGSSFAHLSQIENKGLMNQYKDVVQPLYIGDKEYRVKIIDAEGSDDKGNPIKLGLTWVIMPPVGTTIKGKDVSDSYISAGKSISDLMVNSLIYGVLQ